MSRSWLERLEKVGSKVYLEWVFHFSEFTNNRSPQLTRGAAEHRGSIRAMNPAAPGSNPVSTRSHLVVSMTYERDFANVVSGECLIKSTTTT